MVAVYGDTDDQLPVRHDLPTPVCAEEEREVDGRDAVFGKDGYDVVREGGLCVRRRRGFLVLVVLVLPAYRPETSLSESALS